jgi:molybdopterin-containing oxidoreductase family iron-sulfur binding subunit
LLDFLVDQLWDHRSIILCGSQDVELQLLTNFLNYLLGNYGDTIDLKHPSKHPSNRNESTDQDLETLLRDLHAGKIAALFVHGTNPVHDLPNGDTIAEDLKRVPLLVCLSPHLDETARLAHYVCPDHHYLESWGDAEPVSGVASLVQPAITPLADTRSILESLAAWAEKSRPAQELVREHWEKEVFRLQTKAASFQEFWDNTLEQGFASLDVHPITLTAFNLDAVHPAVVSESRQDDAYCLVLYHKVGMPDSSHAYNPWLHELPDPITKVTWDNYAAVSPATAKTLGVKDGDVIRLEADADGHSLTLELPALIQLGQHDKVVAVALGYGSVLSERFAKIGPQWLQARPTVGEDGQVGKNAASLLQWRQGNLWATRDRVRLQKTGAQHPLASTQDYYQISVPQHLALPGQEMRPVIHEFVLDDFQRAATERKEAAAKTEGDLWPDDHHQPDTVPRWGMAIDLNACTGCSACVIACQAENNIPVVGKDEISRRREMHWLRIDRYYTVREHRVDVAHQPMLCHHCGDAPCEVVCPVLATAHSNEGLNQQVYNRCVGTRYCANNCPYKVRRFNWFDYAHNDRLQNLVINPDVTVRSRGVMEKCTFCVQRIQEARIGAGHHSGERLPDGLVQTACQQSCPAQAIVFGDLRDPKSRVARLAAGARSYQVLGELNIKPAISYLSLVRNRPAPQEGGKNG